MKILSTRDYYKFSRYYGRSLVKVCVMHVIYAQQSYPVSVGERGHPASHGFREYKDHCMTFERCNSSPQHGCLGPSIHEKNNGNVKTWQIVSTWVCICHCTSYDTAMNGDIPGLLVLSENTSIVES